MHFTNNCYFLPYAPNDKARISIDAPEAYTDASALQRGPGPCRTGDSYNIHPSRRRVLPLAESAIYSLAPL